MPSEELESDAQSARSASRAARGPSTTRAMGDASTRGRGASFDGPPRVSPRQEIGSSTPWVETSRPRVRMSSRTSFAVAVTLPGVTSPAAGASSRLPTTRTLIPSARDRRTTGCEPPVTSTMSSHPPRWRTTRSRSRTVSPAIRSPSPGVPERTMAVVLKRAFRRAGEARLDLVLRIRSRGPVTPRGSLRAESARSRRSSGQRAHDYSRPSRNLRGGRRPHREAPVAAPRAHWRGRSSDARASEGEEARPRALASEEARWAATIRTSVKLGRRPRARRTRSGGSLRNCSRSRSGSAGHR